MPAQELRDTGEAYKVKQQSSQRRTGVECISFTTELGCLIKKRAQKTQDK